MDGRDLREEVRRAARGDEDSASLLFDHYYPRVFRYARGKLRDDRDAEDIAAETFARVLRGLHRFRWRGAGFEAWLFRIASNLIVDHVRAAGRERSVAGVADDAAASDESPETTVLRTELTATMLEMLDKLAPEQREVLLLRFGGDLDTNEVGRVMNKNANAVRQLQFRALERLRQLIEIRDRQ